MLESVTPMLSFLGIGAQKAGTTWLYSQLRQHPQLAFPLTKEAHFWNRPHDAVGIQSYLEQFAAVPISGEITPAYAILPIEIIREIYACNPRLRLIYLIRNPIERAWSSALMALQRAEMTIDEASDAWFSDHFHSTGSVKRGDYQSCLQNWRTVFPDEQLLVLRFEQIVNEPETLLNRCFQHLGVSLYDSELLQRQGCRERVFAGLGHPLRLSLKPVLQAIYHERIDDLARYLTMDLDSWKIF
ncbi:MAG: sulfotransferase [Candidatus Competibacteraceae bacterium]|uniref:Sulfotransferase n=1 Tax=Candidatus Contendobacter odensis Run_B_J11 TaxID=1400861 RepID=A0A7U7GDZ8_9GAMM|nr:sulfotransferase [Candidatus Contendobacter odensis]MBK8535308.1 sulfotransferase [Candidatus Competibacteraceae bacterium]CDH46423.1 putative Sulfotransferase [Candidatus Contendobacter odensis Run_B_J11]